MTTLADLVFRFSFEADTKQLDKQLDDAERKAKLSAEKTAQTVEKQFSRTAAGIAKIGAAIAVSVGGLFALTAAASKAGAEIDDVTRRAGVGAREHQRLAFALKQSGGDVQGLATAYKFLDKAIVDARAGTGPAAAAFKTLGVSVQKLSATKDVEQRFQLLADGFTRVKDQSTRTDIALQLFGRSGTELLPLFEDGAAGIAKLGDEAQRFGIVLSDDAIAAAAKFDEQLDRLKAQLGAMATQIGVALIPVVQSVIKNFGDWAKVAVGLGVAFAGLKLGAFAASLHTVVGAAAAAKLGVAGLAISVGALSFALGTAIDNALGLSNAIAGIGVKQGGRTAVNLADLTSSERARLEQLTAQRDAAALNAERTGLSGGAFRTEAAEAQAEIDALQARAASRKASLGNLRKATGLADAEAKRVADAGRESRALVRRNAVDRGIREFVEGAADIVRDVGIAGERQLGTVFSDRKTKRKSGSGKQNVNTKPFESLAGADIRRTGQRVGASELAINAAIKAGASSLQAGDSEGVARSAALSSLGQSTGLDLTTRTTDPLLSSLFGANVPDIELSSLARGADPQVLISTINNTFSFDNDFQIDGAGDPSELGNAIALQLREVFQRSLEASTKTAKVNFAR